jgi:DNA-binding LytR/AlgR family response regulator
VNSAGRLAARMGEQAMRIAVCDDEKVFRDVITEYLKPYKETNPEISVMEFTCGEDLVAVYEQGSSFDLIFLDVEMAGLSGVEAGQKVRELDGTVLFVFITSHTKYVPEAFILNAFQFLVKPVERQMFNKEFDRAMKTYKKSKSKYSFGYKGKISVLEIKDVIYIETFNRHLKVMTTAGSFEFSGNIAAEEKKLADLYFVRCHKGFLVNMNFIYKHSGNAFELTNGEKVPISRYYKNEALESYNKHVSGCCV